MESLNRLILTAPQTANSITSLPLPMLLPRFETTSLAFRRRQRVSMKWSRQGRSKNSTVSSFVAVRSLSSAHLFCSHLISFFHIVSDHPLQHMIREHLGPTSSKPCVGMFESGIAKALMVSRQFGIVSTGEGFKPLLKKGVTTFLGASGSDRFVGSAM